MTLKLKRLEHAEGIEPPAYETSGSAGMDIRAAVDDAMTLAPGKRALVPTGFIFEIPQGFEAQIRPRSGLAFKHGITCLNTPGTIDSDYRGPLGVLLINLGGEPYIIHHGDRIAQAVIAPVMQAAWEMVDTLGETARGHRGFGSTGRK